MRNDLIFLNRYKLSSIPKNKSFTREDIELKWIEPLPGKEGILRVTFQPVSGVEKVLEELIDAIHTRIDNEKKKEADKQRKALKAQPLPLEGQVPPLALVQAVPSSFPQLTSQCEKKASTTEKKEKVKTRGVGFPAERVPPQNEVPVPPKQLIGTDFGFHATVPITPIYCSQGSQKRRHTPFFVYYEEIESLNDEDVVSRFREMLHPDEEGIRAVGPYDEAGPKFMGGLSSADPAKDGFLRFKGKGGHVGGWRIHCPLEEIVDDGRNGQRYLFRMGRAVRK